MKNDIDKQSENILAELVGSISEKSAANLANSKEKTNENIDNNKNSGLKYNNDETHSSDNDGNSVKEYNGKSQKNKRPVKANDLKAEKGRQNLAERKKLLNILKILFAMQLFFMNIVILLIVGWSALNIGYFKGVDIEILNAIIDLTKYYVTAVLVELLAGIIFIVHNVFKDKTIEQLNK